MSHWKMPVIFAAPSLSFRKASVNVIFCWWVKLPEETIARIGAILERRPELILLTDDVYGTFVPGFRSLMGAFPRNTIGVWAIEWKLKKVTSFSSTIDTLDIPLTTPRIVAKPATPNKSKKGAPIPLAERFQSSFGRSGRIAASRALSLENRRTAWIDCGC